MINKYTEVIENINKIVVNSVIVSEIYDYLIESCDSNMIKCKFIFTILPPKIKNTDLINMFLNDIRLEQLAISMIKSILLVIGDNNIFDDEKIHLIYKTFLEDFPHLRNPYK